MLFGEDLPKTRSGKIMRRLLKNIAEGDELGDTTTLRDPAIVEDLKRQADAALGRSAGRAGDVEPQAAPRGLPDELERHDDEQPGEELSQHVVRERGRRVPCRENSRDREHADHDRRPPANVPVAVLAPRADGHNRDHRRERRGLSRELRQVEDENERRDEENAAADAEHPRQHSGGESERREPTASCGHSRKRTTATPTMKAAKR